MVRTTCLSHLLPAITAWAAISASPTVALRLSCFGAGTSAGRRRPLACFATSQDVPSPQRPAVQDSAYEVVLMRHGESLWNRERRFISWVDSPLTDRGVEEARAAGLAIADDGIKFDIVYTSMLKRAIKTAWTVLEASDQCPVPVSPDWRLNERFVGCLIGHTMESATELYGQDRMKDWRSTADIPPAPLDPSSPYNPALDPKYDFLDRNLLPSSECLLDVRARVALFWESTVLPAVGSGKRVLIVAHENSLRALMMHMDPSIPADDVLKFEIPRATPIIYELEKGTMRPTRSDRSSPPLSGRFLAGGSASAKADGCQLTADGQNEVSMDAAAGYR